MGPPRTPAAPFSLGHSPPPRPPHDTPAPDPTGRWTMVRSLGQGWAGPVYLAQDAAGRLAALRTFEPSLEGEWLAMWWDEEVWLESHFRHPGLIALLDAHAGPGTRWLAYQYVDGPALGLLMHKQRATMPIPLAVEIVRQLAVTLGHVHTLQSDDGTPLRCVHGQLTPYAIFLDHAGNMKVDPQRHPATRNASMVAKIAWMAPEQAMGAAVDHRCDQFVLGQLWWEMLTGQRMWQQESELARLLAIKDAAVIPPSTKRAGIPPDMERVMMRMLSRQPQDRFPGCADVLEALAPWATRRGSRLVAAAANAMTLSP